MNPTNIELVEAPQDTHRTPINGSCFLTKVDGCVLVVVRNQPIFSFDDGDVAAERLAMVQLVESGAASQQDVATAFKVTRLTVHRQIAKYREGGVEALVPKKRGPKGPRVTGGRRDRIILNMKKAGVSNREIARRLGTSESSIRYALKRLGYEEKQPVQVELPQVDDEAQDDQVPEAAKTEQEVAEPASAGLFQEMSSERGEVDGPEASVVGAPEAGEEQDAAVSAAASDDIEIPATNTLDPDPTNRTVDRLFARLGLLEDAAPLFGDAKNVDGAGALLAVPVLVKHGVFADAAKVFRPLGAAFYGLRNVVMTLLICMMLGINRPEKLKGQAPHTLGKLLGLDRAPETKTLRRKIRRLSAQERSLYFARAQLKRHLSRLSDDLLWVYVDGHVSVYSGKRKLNKHHVTRLRLSMPSILDYWVNDANGDPLFVFAGRTRKGMVAVLKETIKELRGAGEQRTLTLVFDREGWSPALFAELDKMPGVRFVTYRKAGRGKKLPRLANSTFESHAMIFDGQKEIYELADKIVHIDYGSRRNRQRLKLRQVSRRSDNGKQTHIVTNDYNTSAVELAHRMFSRWGQENFLKYMRHNRDLDALVTYLMEDADPERLVANPKRKEARKELKRQRLELDKLTAAYGAQAIDNSESARPTMRGFKIANGKLGQGIREQQERVQELEAKLKNIPTKVPVSSVVGEGQPKQAHAETRRLMHVFRIVAQRAENSLRELFRPVYPRWRHESHDMVRTFLNTMGDLEVSDGEIRVTLQSQSSPHRTRVLAHLCTEINSLNAKFPGSNLVLRFGVYEA